MGKKIALVLVTSLLFSCAARKVAVTKTQIETHVDSVSVQKKDSVSVQQNAISITEDSSEVEIKPIDTAKPVIINGTKIYNAVVKISRKQKKVVDTSKIVVAKSSQNNVVVSKDFKEKIVDKKVDRKPNYLLYLWLLLIPVVVYLVWKYLPK